MNDNWRGLPTPSTAAAMVRVRLVHCRLVDHEKDCCHQMSSHLLFQPTPLTQLLSELFIHTVS